MILGGISGAVFAFWKVGQWHMRITLENREQEWYRQGRLIPEQPQYLIQQTQPPLHTYNQINTVPGGW